MKKCSNKPENMIGLKYGDLTIVELDHIKEYPQKTGRVNKLYYYKCSCLCGGSWIGYIGSLRAGKTSQCDQCRPKQCYNIIGLDHTKHGEYKTRLYQSWLGMKSRSRERIAKGDNCQVFEQWKNDFLVFKEWSLANGYNDNMLLCRIGDRGGYEPDNVYWGTPQQNIEESKAKNYTITDPTGKRIEIYNLASYCRDHFSDPVNACKGLSSVIHGRKKSYKGYTKA